MQKLHLRFFKQGLAILLGAIMLLSLVSCAGNNGANNEATAQPETAAQNETPPTDVLIVYTNDVHCGVQQVKDGNLVTNIGYAGLSDYVKKLENEHGADNVTLVDAGDAVQGDAIGTLSQGQYLIDIMNEAGYDLFVPGNHEFDYGMARMQELMKGLNAEVISSNFMDLLTEKTVYKPYTIINYGSVKVAFVGITTPESFTKSTPTYFQNESGEYIYGFCEGNNGENLYAAVQSAVDAALKEQADYVIAVGHLGIDEISAPYRSTDVIANTTGIDAFIDAHSHSVVDSQTVQNKDGGSVILTQTGTKLQNIGLLKITAEGVITTELISGYTEQDTATLAFTEDIYANFNDDLAEVVGKTDVALTVSDPSTGNRMVRNRETNLGDLCADAYRFVLGNGKTGGQAGPADVAFVNGGGIRENIDAGDIMFGEVISVHPFNNAGCVVEALGSEILDALEMASRAAPGELGGFLQVSGLTYAIDTSIESTVETDDKGNFIKVGGERRVKDAAIGGKPIDLNQTYTLASHNYMLLDGGDGINMFRDNTIVVQPVILDNQVLITYIGEHLGGTVGQDYADAYGQGRIRILPEEKIAVGFKNTSAVLAVVELARYSSGQRSPDGGICEIVAYSSKDKYAYAVNGQEGILTAINLGGLSGGNKYIGALTGKNVNIAELVSAEGFEYGDLSSVAVSPDGTKLAVAIQDVEYSKAGCVAVLNLEDKGDVTLDGIYETGVQPDMVMFHDANTILTADEGEPRDGYGAGTTDPKGSVTIINLSAQTSKTVYFDKFDAQRNILTDSGVVIKKDTAPSVDLEPEYIAAAGNMVFVTLQEANAVAALDVENGEFTGIHPLGFQDYSEISVDFDNTSDTDGAYSPALYANTYGVRMPDGIASFQSDGKTYIVTANEGDSREWGDESVGTYYLNETEYNIISTGGVETAKEVRFLTGDYDGLPGNTGSAEGMHYTFGARAFTVFEVTPDGLELAYDSGSDFERLTAEYLPDYFNCSNDDTTKDSRSNKKGPEPETVILGVISGKTFAFISLEHVGGVMMYDITDPSNITYVNYINSRDFINVDDDGIGHDDSAEGLFFIPASASPTGEALLAAAFEVSGEVSVYELAARP
ncbi:MAG: bifunctional metallophosphatase/5'-nucleotidase [Clostridiales bacterium]|jgi:2',3'-cyclic-nucleotide 2'-phosphodiesterase (5'-nucleotidase family)|nr:bifunctional metallophosphatase/5'-nucleotidase [Clostridiales bacterium]